MHEFDDIARRLQEERPELSALELDRVKQRARTRAAGPSRKGQPMRSRLAILLMLVFGMLVSTTGAGLAISGISGNAADHQYGHNNAQDDDDDGRYGGGVLGEDEDDAGGGDSPGTVGGDSEDNGVAGESDLQPTRQVEAGAQGGDDELPFTGFAAVPILLGGIALLTGGLVLRRREAGDR